MPKGGKRAGAGRPKGVLNASTIKRRDIAQKALDSGITPLDVMLQNMRAAVETGEAEFAQSCARDAAPYLHPRLSAMEVKANVDVTETIEVTNDMRWKAIQAALDKVAK